MSTPTLSRSSQILLPFAEKEWISVERTMAILSVPISTLYRIRAAHDAQGRPFIDVADWGVGRRKRVLYASVVRYCDYLRQRYGIPDRRPPLANAIFRHRDEDLLPFPIRDTIGVRQAMALLGYETRRPISLLAEEGKFEAYRLLEIEGSPWRISRSSIGAWMEHAGLIRRPGR